MIKNWKKKIIFDTFSLSHYFAKFSFTAFDLLQAKIIFMYFKKLFHFFVSEQWEIVSTLSTVNIALSKRRLSYH